MARKGLSLGKVEGVITREKVTCSLRFPDPDSKFVSDLKVFSVNADMTLDASGLKGKGSMKGFMGLGAEDVEFFLGTNGDGWMAMSKKFDLAGAVKVDGSLSGSF